MKRTLPRLSDFSTYLCWNPSLADWTRVYLWKELDFYVRFKMEELGREPKEEERPRFWHVKETSMSLRLESESSKAS